MKLSLLAFLLVTSIAPRREYVTLPVAAERLGVHTKTLRRLIATGQLTGYRIGSKLLRVDAAEVDALLKPIPTAALSRR